MRYESLFERFDATGPQGIRHIVEFGRSAFLTAGDQPELFFFGVDGEQAVVAISGSALKRFEQRRRLSREEKIDIAGLLLKRTIEAGAPLDSENLMIRDELLAQLAGKLRIPA